MSGNLFEDRNCLLPKNYLVTENQNENVTGITSPKPSLKEEPKIGEQSVIRPKTEKCGWGPDCPFCKNQDKGRLGWQTSRSVATENITTTKSAKDPSKMVLKLTEA